MIIQLLDDGTGRDPLEVYNFGKAGNYLFRPCKKEDGSIDEVCLVTVVYSDSLLYFKIFQLNLIDLNLYIP